MKRALDLLASFMLLLDVAGQIVGISFIKN